MKRRVIGVLVLAAVAAGAAGAIRAHTSRAPDPAGLQTARVERGTVEQIVSADGTLKPLTTVAVKSYAGGRVDVLAVDVGDRVEPGDLIAKIDPTDSRTTYDQALADRSAAEAKLQQSRDQAKAQPTLTRTAIAQAEAAYNSAIKNLDLLRKATEPQTRAAARAALDKARSNLQIAKQELARVQGLKTQGFVAQSEVDSAVNKQELAQAELASAQQRWDTLEAELAAETEAAEAQVAQAKAALENARANAIQDRLKEADVASAEASVARAEAEVVNAKTMLDYTIVRAPRAGVILEKLVEQGTIITSGRSSITEGTDLVVLGDLSKMFVEVSVDEADVDKIRPKQEVTIQVDAFPDASFHGRVTRIDPQASTEQNITTVLVTVQIEDPNDALKPGMSASCDFLAAKAENMLSVPNRAVRERDGEHFVTVLRGNGPVDAPVQIGVVGDERTEIRQGLQEGEEVVLPGLVTGPQPGSAGNRESGPPPPPGGVGSFFRGGR